MGAIDEAFDRGCIARVRAGAEAPLDRLLDDALEAAGNGSHEVRNWVIAHAAAGSRGFDLIDYRADAGSLCRLRLRRVAGAVAPRLSRDSA